MNYLLVSVFVVVETSTSRRRYITLFPRTTTTVKQENIYRNYSEICLINNYCQCQNQVKKNTLYHPKMCAYGPAV
jgi:hypothetical protein